MKSNTNHTIKYIPFLLIIILLTGCNGKAVKQSQSAFILDTFVDISIYSDQDCEDLLKECISICEDYDKLFSVSNPDSDIYKLNHANGNPITVSSETIYVLEKEIYYSEISHNKLNPAIHSIYEQWGFRDGFNTVPDDKLIKELLRSVDVSNIAINKNQVQLKNNAQINLGAVAKGYIADQIKEYLINNHIESAIINLGGNIQTIGTKSDGTSYKIGIQKPFDSTGSILTDVSVSNKTVVTSGIYQRYFEENDHIYHHILDPQTGFPSESDLYSASIIGDSSLEADALSTICVMMGSNDCKDFLKQFPNVSAILVDRNLNIIRIH